MRTLPTNTTVQDFLKDIDRGEIKVNREYQRNDQVWPDAARSYLIETILLDFPIPKLSLHQVLDVQTGVSYRELVDGQQRCGALREFREGKFSLSASVDNPSFRGLSYSDLTPQQRSDFLNYQLSIDLFIGATADQIRETFRRMNSYTAPLNPEEQRHATYQGAFKWFLHRTALRFNQSWTELGVFSPKKIVRMADVKLLAEVSHALIYGITTTNKTALDNLYKSNDKSFARSDDFEDKFTQALDQLVSWTELRKTALMKPHQIYSLMLALIHVRTPAPELNAAFPMSKGKSSLKSAALDNLLTLSDALENDVTKGPVKNFIQASAEKTNVKAQRETRFKWFCRALTGDSVLD